MTRDTEKCPLSVLTGVRIKRVDFRESIQTKVSAINGCLYYAGVRRAGFHVSSFSLSITTSLRVILGLLLCLDDEAYELDRGSRVRGEIKDWPSMLGMSITHISHPKN